MSSNILPNETFRFLDLPEIVRDEIYELVVGTDTNFIISPSYDEEDKGCLVHKTIPWISDAILLVNKQINLEVNAFVNRTRKRVDAILKPYLTEHVRTIVRTGPRPQNLTKLVFRIRKITRLVLCREVLNQLPNDPRFMAVWKSSILITRVCNGGLTMRFLDSIDSKFAAVIHSLLMPGPSTGICRQINAVRDNLPNLREMDLFVPNKKKDLERYCRCALDAALRLLTDGKIDVVKLFCWGAVNKDVWNPFVVMTAAWDSFSVKTLRTLNEDRKSGRIKESRFDGEEAMRCLRGGDRQVSCVLTLTRTVED